VATIARIEATAIKPDFSLRWTERAGRCFLSTTIVRVTDSDGCQGIGGFDSYSPAAVDLSVVESVRSLAPALLGRDADSREEFLEEMRIGVVFPFSPGPLAVLDVALWDLAARRSGLPLYRFLGGARESIPAYASLTTMDTEEEYLEVADRARAEGIGAMKVHAWGDPARDVALLRRLRAADLDMTLMYDAEGVYDRREALWVAREIEELDCRWFEAPLPDFDLAGYRDLLARVDVPILPAGYAMWDVRQFAEALRDPPWSAARSEITCTLGITWVLKLMRLAAAFDMDLELVSYGHTMCQLAALHVMLAFDNVSYFELPYPVEPWEYAVAAPIRPDGSGLVRAPEAPGLGLELDWERVRSLAAGEIALAV
jgi:L-alanine-DL-glutamate epimerase-like enolase superfamily enzyme